MNGKITIKADPDTQDLIPGYLEKKKNEIAILREALVKQNFDLIQSLSHSMKGSGGGYGFDGITEIGAVMESATKLKDINLIEKSILDLADYLQRVEVIYDQ